MSKLKVRAVFDNGGETLDRYTIIFDNGDMIGASEDPTHPLGFGQYCGNVVDNYMNNSFGYSWRKHVDVESTVKRVLSEQIAAFKSEGHIGKQVFLKDLPEAVRNYVEWMRIPEPTK